MGKPTRDEYLLVKQCMNEFPGARISVPLFLVTDIVRFIPPQTFMQLISECRVEPVPLDEADVPWPNFGFSMTLGDVKPLFQKYLVHKCYWFLSAVNAWQESRRNIAPSPTIHAQQLFMDFPIFASPSFLEDSDANEFGFGKFRFWRSPPSNKEVMKAKEEFVWRHYRYARDQWKLFCCLKSQWKGDYTWLGAIPVESEGSERHMEHLLWPKARDIVIDESCPETEIDTDSSSEDCPASVVTAIADPTQTSGETQSWDIMGHTHVHTDPFHLRDLIGLQPRPFKRSKRVADFQPMLE